MLQMSLREANKTCLTSRRYFIVHKDLTNILCPCSLLTCSHPINDAILYLMVFIIHSLVNDKARNYKDSCVLHGMYVHIKVAVAARVKVQPQY